MEARGVRGYLPPVFWYLLPVPPVIPMERCGGCLVVGVIFEDFVHSGFLASSQLSGFGPSADCFVGCRLGGSVVGVDRHDVGAVD
jgi:hypothetical protein